MVLGVTELLNTNLGISITGIAGPGGETPDKGVQQSC
ncbi:MAG TPA: damage-inducible protein CinA, partial [Piscirickettsiaceae bacterium]|nr:damage-inducible protein CinA [Piscirickettsiaceae bacterium]